MSADSIPENRYYIGLTDLYSEANVLPDKNRQRQAFRWTDNTVRTETSFWGNG